MRRFILRLIWPKALKSIILSGSQVLFVRCKKCRKAFIFSVRINPGKKFYNYDGKKVNGKKVDRMHSLIIIADDLHYTLNAKKSFESYFFLCSLLNKGLIITTSSLKALDFLMALAFAALSILL